MRDGQQFTCVRDLIGKRKRVRRAKIDGIVSQWTVNHKRVREWRGTATISYTAKNARVASRLVGTNGPLRRLSLALAFCVLILCRECNEGPFMDKSIWPEARQLCLLQARAPERYDLPAYLAHTNQRAPRRITQNEVDAYRDGLP